jgi:hypothetical protein
MQRDLCLEAMRPMEAKMHTGAPQRGAPGLPLYSRIRFDGSLI